MVGDDSVLEWAIKALLLLWAGFLTQLGWRQADRIKGIENAVASKAADKKVEAIRTEVAGKADSARVDGIRSELAAKIDEHATRSSAQQDELRREVASEVRSIHARVDASTQAITAQLIALASKEK